MRNFESALVAVLALLLLLLSTAASQRELKKNQSPELSAVHLKLNKTHANSFGGFSKLIVGEAHYYFVNASDIRLSLQNCNQEKEQRQECVQSKAGSTNLILEVVQEQNPDVFMEVYMDRNGLPTERKYEFKTDTREKDSRQIALPPLSSGANWFVWVKPSRNPGVLSSLQYTIVIYENAGEAESSSSSLSILLVTLVAIALGAAAFWKFGKSGAADTSGETKKEDNRGFRWLREEGNDLIPLSELATRKQEISYDLEVKKPPPPKEDEIKKPPAAQPAAPSVAKPKGQAVGQMAQLWEKKSSDSLK